MARPSTPPTLFELRHASSPSAQVKALKQLKNEIIGHEQRKEYWVRWGILRHLVRILNSHDGVTEGEAGAHEGSRRTDNEEAKLQAVIVVGSLAHGGPAFIPPLHASAVLPLLLNHLSLDHSSPRIVLQILRTIDHMADSTCLSTREHSLKGGLLDALYTQETLHRLALLIMESDRFGTEMPQVEIIASILSRTCREEARRRLLDQSSVLEALSVQLSKWINTTIGIHDEHVSVHSRLEPRRTVLSNSPRESVRQALLLHAIGLIVQGSATRAQLLISHCDHNIERAEAGYRSALEDLIVDIPANVKASLSALPSMADRLLPTVPTLQLKAPRSAIGHPPLDPIKIIDRPGTKSSSTAVEVFSSRLEPVQRKESILVPWLIHMGRCSDESVGLASTWLLAILYRLRLTNDTSERSIALLAIPSLVKSLETCSLGSDRAKGCHAKGPAYLSLSDRLKGDAPAILAKLIVNNPKILTAAVDAGAIPKLSRLLKQSFDGLSLAELSPAWSAEPLETSEPLKNDETARMGTAGIAPAVLYTMTVRENTMVALAALASDKDEHRKSIVEGGVIPFIVRALKAEDVKFALPNGENPDKLSLEQKIAQGTCRESILAACCAIRALARSVATLRTSLMEAGLVEPMQALLKCHDTAIKVQATSVICNLIMEFSPMRDAMFEAGIPDILCEMVHSNNSALRLNALWAMRNVVTRISLEMRVRYFEQLGLLWLKQIISADAEVPSSSRHGDREDGNITPMRMSTPNAAGEQVDLLNAVDDSRESSQALEEDGDEDTRMSDSVGSLSKSDESIRLRQNRPSKPRPTLNLQASKNPTHQIMDLPNDTAMAKLGLEFIRNAIIGDNVPEMIDYILSRFGQDDFFRILASKLRPKVVGAFNRDRKSSPDGGMRHIPPNSEILLQTIYILVHIASSEPQHKNLLLSYDRLLKCLLPLFAHPEPEVRAGCSWVAFNIVWNQDNDDLTDARGRATRLAEMGFVEKLREMEGDEDLNCKERARNAIMQMHR